MNTIMNGYRPWWYLFQNHGIADAVVFLYLFLIGGLQDEGSQAECATEFFTDETDGYSKCLSYADAPLALF